LFVASAALRATTSAQQDQRLAAEKFSKTLANGRSSANSTKVSPLMPKEGPVVRAFWNTNYALSQLMAKQ
jgi:hypothetical protein